MNALILNWDNLRLVLTVARSGSYSGAARRLGLCHSTVGRRVAALERSMGVSLFVLDGNSRALTRAGELAVRAALGAELEVSKLQRMLTKMGT